MRRTKDEGRAVFSAAGVPEIKIPVDGTTADFGSIVKRPEGCVECNQPLGSLPIFVVLGHGPDAQRVRKEKSDNRPNNPKRTALVVCGIGGLRFGEAGFGSLLVHVESLAGPFWFGKRFVVESANGCRMRNENGGPVDVCLAHAATEQKDPRHSALTGRYVGLHQPALTAYWPGVRRSFGLDGESVK
jgi:hypothetical protein